MSQTTTAQRGVYGQISTPSKPGLMGLSLASTGVLFGTLSLVTIFSIFGRFLWSLPFAALGVVAFWFVSTGKRDGQSRLERLAGRRGFSKASKAGYTILKQGPVSQIPDGSARPAGLLARTELHEFTTPWGVRWGMIWHEGLKTGTALISAHSAGLGLQDQADIDQMVAHWARVLRDGGSQLDLVQMGVTTQSSIDPGQRLPHLVNRARENHAEGAQIDPFVRSTIDSVVDELKVDVPKVEQWIAVTFSAAANARAGIPARTREELAADMSDVLPQLLESIQHAGAGRVALMVPEDITDMVHVAYNPDRAVAVEAARMSEGATGLKWGEVGPVHAQEHPDAWEHSDHYSRTWQVWQPPLSIFTDKSLKAVMEPDKLATMKRVTVLYRSLDAEQSQQVVSTARKNAEFKANQKNQRVSAAVSQEVRRAQITENEQAAGEAIVRFSIVITATTQQPQDFGRLEANIRRACNKGVQMRIRNADYNQSAGFAFGMGLGLVPNRHASLPSSIIDAL